MISWPQVLQRLEEEGFGGGAQDSKGIAVPPVIHARWRH